MTNYGKRKVIIHPVEGLVLPAGIVERPRNLYRYQAFCERDGRREHHTRVETLEEAMHNVQWMVSVRYGPYCPGIMDLW